MGVPLVQLYRIGSYIISQRIRGRRHYPLVLMLEPLFKCNLTCNGCGKIDYPEEILARRMNISECIYAAEECGAPVVSIAGGEPLLHEEMPRIVEEMIRRKKFVYLCTNGLLLKKKMHAYSPSPYLTFSVHLDGNKERHDASVGQEGVFDIAVDAIRAVRAKGFRVTINCTIYNGISPDEVADFFDFAMGLGIEGITVSPGFNYERAYSQEVFLKRTASKELFRNVLKARKSHGWKFNHTSLYLDFLAGNQTYQCTPWGNPTRNIFGWQRPCYLLPDDGYAPSFKALMEETDWSKWGLGRSLKCADCMMHCGFEATAVNDTFAHPFKALWRTLSGSRTEGAMEPDLAMTGVEEAEEWNDGVQMVEKQRMTK